MTRREQIDWYDAPRYYDIIFGEDTRREASFLERVGAEYGPGRKRVLEPACGTGRLMMALARRGWQCTGFDLNPHMLRYAARRLRRTSARLHEADMIDFRVPGRFDLAHCLVSSFKYLQTEHAAHAHLKAVARALVPGGVYVLGFHLTDYEDRSCARERWVVRRGDTTVVSNLQVWPAHRRKRLERVRARLRVLDKAGERSLETYWTFRTYSVAQVKRLLRAVRVFDHVATYDFDYDQPRSFDGERLDTVLILRRR